MRQISLGGTGLMVSELCMGAMMYGTKVDEAASFRLLDAFVDAGGNFIDTSNNYAHWAGTGDESETLLGRWFERSGKRAQIVLATKVGFDRHGAGAGLREHQILRWCDESLRKMKTDVIDLYYSHVDDADTPLEETMGAFDRLIKVGKVRALGASNFYTWRLLMARQVCADNGFEPYSVLQQRYTYLFTQNGVKKTFPFNEQASTEKLRYLAQARMPLVAYSCSAGGGYHDNDRLAPDLVRGERLKTLNNFARETGVPAQQLALAWLLNSWRFRDRPTIIPLFSASRPETLQDNIAACDIQLGNEAWAALNEA